LSKYTHTHTGIINRKPPRIHEAPEGTFPKQPLSKLLTLHWTPGKPVENPWKTGGNCHQKQMIPTILKNSILLKHNIKKEQVNE